jgi:hypothetical protein
MFTEIIAKLTEGDLVAVVLAALVAAVLIVRFGGDALVSLVRGHAPADELDIDELADRIEAVITSATVDLLGALEAIEQDTSAIRESNAHVEEVAKLRPRAWTAARPPYDFSGHSDTPDRHAEQAIDLTKPYQPTDLRG